MARTFYTADTHYFHKNIIRHSNRPFRDVDHMHEELVRRWNEVVGENDTVWHLGDVSFGKISDTLPILERLNGFKMLVAGNHDPTRMRRQSSVWNEVYDLVEIRDYGKNITLCHYALKVWNKSHHGALNLHGHSHGTLKPTAQQCDVGVDCWDYRPVTLPQILARMSEAQPHYLADHHGRRDFENV